MAFYQCVKVGGGGSADIVEVTLAEYIALGDVVNTDGKLYCITDLNNSDVQGYPPMIYSVDEREVGVWYNGKPLYQKTLVYPNAKRGRVDGLAHNIADVEEIFITFWVWREANGESNIVGFENAQQNWWGSIFQITRTVLSYRIGENWGAGDLILTVRYTKTTDVAGGGIWNGQGCYAHHYSMSETAIGTWIDGSSLYEKTINIGRMACNTSWHYLNHNIPNVKDVVDIKGIMFMNVSPYKHYPIPIYRPTVSQGVIIGADSTAIQYMNNWQDSDNTVYITMQYTKTTD